MDDLDNKWYPDSLTRDEVTLSEMASSAACTVPLVGFFLQEEELAKRFRYFIDYCLQLIGKQRDLYPPANRAAQGRLQNMLRYMSCIYMQISYYANYL